MGPLTARFLSLFPYICTIIFPCGLLSTLKMDAAHSSEILVTFYHTTWPNILEGSKLCTHTVWTSNHTYLVVLFCTGWMCQISICADTFSSSGLPFNNCLTGLKNEIYIYIIVIRCHGHLCWVPLHHPQHLLFQLLQSGLIFLFGSFKCLDKCTAIKYNSGQKIKVLNTQPDFTQEILNMKTQHEI